MKQIGPLRRLCGAAALLLAALASGCTVGPDFASPPPPDVAHYLPRGRDAAAGVRRGADVPGFWWEAFRSRYLNELISQGLEHNADLQAAEAAVRVAQANALAQRGALFPQVTANFNPTRQKVATDVSSGASSNATVYSLHTAQVSVSFVPDVFGGTRRQLESAEALLEVQAFQREGVLLTLTTNIALAAIQEASLRGQIAATRRLVALQTQLLGILRRLNSSGQIPQTDVLTQETALAQTRLLLPPLERQLAQQRNLLATLTGRFPSDEIAGSFQLGSFRFPRALPLSVPADIVRQRPDVRAAEGTLHAQNALIGVAIANRLPQITLTANAGSSATAFSRLFSAGSGFWMVAGNVVQPVFDGGVLFHRQQAAQAAFDQAAAQYRGTVLTAFQNVADVLAALQADARAIAAARAAEQSANRSLTLVRRQLEQGQVSLPSLVTAQQAYLQTSIARVQAEASRLADAVALFQALGGGWWNRTPPVPVDPAGATPISAGAPPLSAVPPSLRDRPEPR